jgi:hypothetical protein
VPQSATKDATLINSGNSPATVAYALAGTDAAKFSAPATGNAPVGSTAVSVQFTADVPAGKRTATLGATTSDVLCAPLPGTTALAAESTIGAYSDNGSTFLFGNDSQPGRGGAGFKYCGTTAQPNTLTICNNGTNDFTLTSVALPKAFYTATPSANVVPANGGCVNVTLSSSAIPQTLTKDQNGNYVFDYGDTLTVTTDIPGDTAHTYSLQQSAFGAIVDRVSPVAIAFPDTQVSTASQFQFLARNIGNATASLGFTLADAPSPWFTMPTISGLIGQQTFAASFTPTNAQGYADNATLVTTGGTVLCAPLPANTQAGGITLSGKGIPAGNGVFGLSPAAAVFGSTSIDDANVSVGVFCGSPAGASTKTFTLSNGTIAAAPYTASITSGSSYYSLSSAGGNVPAGAQVNLQVSSAAIPLDSTPGAHRDGVLTVVIGGNTYTASLTTVVGGTFFRWQTPNGSNILNLAVGVGLQNATGYQMKNDGNAQFNYSLGRGVAGGQTNEGNFFLYPNSPPGNGNPFPIALSPGAAQAGYVFAINNQTSIMTMRPNPISAGVVCSSNFQELVLTH